MEDIHIRYKDLEQNGNMTLSNTSFVIALQQMMARGIDFAAEASEFGHYCNCSFQKESLLTRDNWSDFEQDAYFILENNMEELIPAVYNYGDM